jgi:hypothetical protein
VLTFKIRETVNLAAKQIGIAAYSNTFTKKIYDVSADIIGIAGKKLVKDYAVNSTRSEVERAWASIAPENAAVSPKVSEKITAIKYLYQDQKPSRAGFIAYKTASKPIIVDIKVVVSKQKAPAKKETPREPDHIVKKEEQILPIGGSDRPLREPLHIKGT